MDVKSKPRRRHSGQLKAEVIAACAEPGASVAAVARRFDLNDNLVHQWRRGRGTGALHTLVPTSQPGAAQFVALSLPSPPITPTPPPPAPRSTAPNDSIRIELQRGSTSVRVGWPLAASADCAAWLRELLG